MNRRTSRRWRLAPIAAAVMTTAIAPATRAQGGDTALALSLFEEGRKLAADGDYGAACPKFLASYNQVQKLGTLLNLADCYEKQGKTASAWARFAEAQGLAERAGQQDRVEFAKQHAEALAPKLSRLTINVAAAPPGLDVKRDGTVVDAAAFGVAAPVDPGMHAIEARAPGKRPWSTTVQVGAQTARAVVDVPALENEPVAPPPSAAPQEPARPQTVVVYQQQESPPTPGSAQRTWGVVAGVVGVVGVGLGFVGGVFAQKEYEQSNEQGRCENDVCTNEGLRRREDAATIAGVSTGFVVGGGLLLAGGIALYVTAPSGKSAPKAAVSAGPSSILIRGTW